MKARMRSAIKKAMVAAAEVAVVERLRVVRWWWSKARMAVA